MTDQNKNQRKNHKYILLIITLIVASIPTAFSIAYFDLWLGDNPIEAVVFFAGMGVLAGALLGGLVVSLRRLPAR